jgi:type I restriction enzyme S subunit
LNLANTDRHLSVEEATGKYAHFLLDEDDLVIASSGISFDEDGLLRTRGAFVENEHLPLCLNTSTIRFKPKEGQSDLNFLRHWLNGLEFRTQITKLVTGSAQQNFGPTHLKALSISIPPLEEQRRIAAILDQAETLQTKRRQALAHLDTLTQSLFLDMFGDPVANSMGWPSYPLADSVEGKYGIKAGPFGSSLKKEDYVASGFRVYGQEQVIAGRFDIGDYYIDERKFHQLKSCAIQEGDLLVSLVGSFGKVLIVPANVEPGIINPRLLKITLDPMKLTPVFVTQLLGSSQVQRKLASLSHGGTMGILNASLLKELGVITPPLALQQTFATRIQAIETLKATHHAALAQLDALFASLQQRAFAGKL